MQRLTPSTGQPAVPQPGIDPALADTLASWQSEGRKLVSEHWLEFSAHVAATKQLINRGRHVDATAMAQVAANHAVISHSGLFASPALEQALLSLGMAAIPSGGAARRPGLTGRGMRVLHVATQVDGIGGHVRMMRRWIGADGANEHVLAMTRQIGPVPELLRTAITETGGRITYCNRRMGGPLDWARSLQTQIASADLIVLHVHNQDIIPFLALSGMRRKPPVILLNHADHVFWLGARFVDLVVNTRRSGQAICASRRGIEDTRNALLPLCLEPPSPEFARTDAADAKRRLGLSEDSIVLLTIARAVKFRFLGGLSFADALLPVLRHDRRVHLVAVGPGGSADWTSAEAEVPGQILSFSERTDTGDFYAAADIYIDSFPFPSITSLHEAGLAGLPLVTRFPFGAGCEIMGADSIGLDEVLVRTFSLEDFQAAVSRMVNDAGLRADIGDKTKASIEKINMGVGWRSALDGIYDQVLSAEKMPDPLQDQDVPRFDPVDVFNPFVFGAAMESAGPANRLARAREIGLKTMPPIARLRIWALMTLRREFCFRTTSKAWRYLVPEWVSVRLRNAVS